PDQAYGAGTVRPVVSGFEIDRNEYPVGWRELDGARWAARGHVFRSCESRLVVAQRPLGLAGPPGPCLRHCQRLSGPSSIDTPAPLWPLQECGRGRTVESGSSALGQVSQHVAPLLTTGGNSGEYPLNVSAATFAGGAVARLAPCPEDRCQ